MPLLKNLLLQNSVLVSWLLLAAQLVVVMTELLKLIFHTHSSGLRRSVTAEHPE